jgi:hypothetical protein
MQQNHPAGARIAQETRNLSRIQFQERMFFSEEKNQKTFMSAPAAANRPWPDNGEPAEKVKVFWFFSSEKNIFTYALSGCLSK